MLTFAAAFAVINLIGALCWLWLSWRLRNEVRNLRESVKVWHRLWSDASTRALVAETEIERRRHAYRGGAWKANRKHRDHRARVLAKCAELRAAQSSNPLDGGDLADAS